MTQGRRLTFLLVAAVGGLLLLGGLWLALSQPKAPQPTPARLTPSDFVSTSTTDPTPIPSVLVTYPVNTPASTPAATATHVSTTDLKSAPAFNLARENGDRVRLKNYQDQGTVVLVFFRGLT